MKRNIALLSMLLIACGLHREVPDPIDDPTMSTKHRVLDPTCTNPPGAPEFKDEHARLAINAVPCYSYKSAPIFVTEHLCKRGIGLGGGDHFPYIEVKVEDRSGDSAALTYIYAYVQSTLQASWALHTKTGQPCTPRDGSIPREVQQWLNRDTSISWYCAEWESAQPESMWCYPL